MSLRLLPLLVALLVSVPALAAEAFGRDVAEVARTYRDTRPKLRIEACNGLVEDVLRDVGIDLRGNVRTLFATMKERGWVHTRKVPRDGDVVFFDKTYDSNRNGRQDDPLSHVAVVISVDDDGTIHMVHRGSKGIRPLTMNLHRPGERRDGSGKVLNSWLGAPGYAKEGHKLAGELWRAFATPEPEGAIARSEPVTLAHAAAEPGSRRSAAERRRSPADGRRGRRPDRPPVALTDEAFVRTWEGRRLRRRHLAGRSCRELWFLRNTLFARHGYAFRGPDALAAFAAVPVYQVDRRVNAHTAGEHLTRRDRRNLEDILDLERAWCGRR